MPVKGGYLILAGSGALVLWSGIRGKSWSQVLQTLIKGQSPKDLPQSQAIVGSSTSGGNVFGGGSGTAPSSNKEKAVWIAMLAAAGAPPTPANIRSLVAWRTHESPWNSSPPDGANYTHNPLNTTYSKGSTGVVNGVGVRIYPNWVVGIRATVATWQGYPAILSALKSGKGVCGGGFGSEFMQWSGNGYSSVC